MNQEWETLVLELRDADAAVEKAIEARGWTCCITNNLVQPGTWRAIVWTGAARPGTRTYRPSHDAHGDTPAAALLGAYLAALEAADADEPETARFTAALKAENETLRAAVLGIANTLRDTDGE